MGDAEVIPLGTRGRPGRGTGQGRPSASSRSLAGSRRDTPSSRSGTGSGPTRAHRAPDSHEDSHGEATTTGAVPGPEPVGAGPDGRAGIPVSAWVDAVTDGAREVFGQLWEPRLAELLAFLRRRVTGEYAVDEYGFDAEVTSQFLTAVVRPIAHAWFRVEVRGLENLPSEGGALVVSNHSGTLPMDALVTMAMVHEHTGRFLRPLGADLVFRLPVVSEVARRSGATLACHEDAERMLRGGELVGVWPEGFKGIGKPFSERYKLQRFGRGGFVSSAVTTGVPIVPLSVVGAEEIYPLVGDVPALARLLGAPYVPITPFFPWLGPLGMVPLPSKWILEFGEPVRTDELEEGAGDDPMVVFDVTDQVRETIQQTLYALLRKRPGPFAR
jgi:1-acyl-sn-glycerol-3-phosphate acyltransferase